MKLMHAVVDATYTHPEAGPPRLSGGSDSLGAPIERCLMVDDQPRNINGALLRACKPNGSTSRDQRKPMHACLPVGIDAAESVGRTAATAANAHRLESRAGIGLVRHVNRHGQLSGANVDFGQVRGRVSDH